MEEEERRRAEDSFKKSPKKSRNSQVRPDDFPRRPREDRWRVRERREIVYGWSQQLPMQPATCSPAAGRARHPFV